MRPLSTSSLTFEPLDLFTDRDGDLIAQAHDWEWPEEPMSRELLQRDAQLHADCFRRDWALREGGEFVAGLTIWEMVGQLGQAKAHFDLHFDMAREREELFVASVEHLEREAAAARFRTAYVFIREDRPGRSSILQRMGYEMEMEDKATRADLSGFDVSAWRQDLERLAEAGCKLATLAQLEEQGVDWKREYYELRKRLFEDVPISGGWVKPSFEDSVRTFDDPMLWSKEFSAVAITAEGKMVATSELYPNRCVSTIASTGLTGVDREWRRQRLATCLKVFLMDAAKRRGILYLSTGNEKDNPMLDLNYQLGFRDWFTMRTWRKALPGDHAPAP